MLTVKFQADLTALSEWQDKVLDKMNEAQDEIFLNTVRTPEGVSRMAELVGVESEPAPSFGELGNRELDI
jgi:hypothetical protein